jgi:hypothetical protein
VTTVIVDSGSCGYTVTISVKMNEEKKLVVSGETDCAMVRKMLEEVAVLDRFAPLTGFLKNPVYLAAGKHLKHVACLVPSGILKAAEVEAGMNVAKDASVKFIKQETSLS